jgi:hypothetical protein
MSRGVGQYKPMVDMRIAIASIRRRRIMYRDGGRSFDAIDVYHVFGGAGEPSDQ